MPVVHESSVLTDVTEIFSAAVETDLVPFHLIS